jgi:C-terminal processing protease CtpA/Prc
MALETTVKLSVNVVLSVVAVCTLAQLWQHNCSQQKKLQAIRMEDKRIEGRVNHLRTDFSRYFDPDQAKNIMQEQSDRLAPGQYPVVLLAPGAKGVAATAPISKK